MLLRFVNSHKSSILVVLDVDVLAALPPSLLAIVVLHIDIEGLLVVVPNESEAVQYVVREDATDERSDVAYRSVFSDLESRPIHNDPRKSGSFHRDQVRLGRFRWRVGVTVDNSDDLSSFLRQHRILGIHDELRVSQSKIPAWIVKEIFSDPNEEATALLLVR
jgi:hypothetical protein